MYYDFIWLKVKRSVNCKIITLPFNNNRYKLRRQNYSCKSLSCTSHVPTMKCYSPWTTIPINYALVFQHLHHSWRNSFCWVAAAWVVSILVFMSGSKRFDIRFWPFEMFQLFLHCFKFTRVLKAINLSSSVRISYSCLDVSKLFLSLILNENLFLSNAFNILKIVLHV